MDFLTADLLRDVPGGAGAGADLRAIWQEYEDSTTLESRYVHDIDKIELLLQTVEYEKRGRGTVDTGEFAYVARKITLPEIRLWAAELLKERAQFWGAREHIRGELIDDGGATPEWSVYSL
ncbi:hypothetical protein RJ55_05625 [Drechmeria coniospora]|nr:hypothetical protein RJ55_05625 [Drechmeria coniospora]